MPLIIHTPTPIMELTHLVGGSGVVMRGETPRHEQDCFYGWSEKAEHERCEPHHVVHPYDEDACFWISRELVQRGRQVVVTRTNEIGDDEVHPEMPISYDRAAHAH